jgi:opacity protein-like surface antigen
MKSTIAVLAASAALSTTILAGVPMAPAKEMVPPAPEHYGTGWYGAIGGGLNLYQDLGGDQKFNRVTDVSGGGREVTTRRNNKISLEPNDSGIGGFGGIKLGYVFGTAFVRPALEADLYYNGIDSDIDAKVNGNKVGSVSSRIDSGAFMANSLLRFNFEKFQPYLGFGIGYWCAQGNDVTVKLENNKKYIASTNSQDGFAWQLVAGADYYFNPKFSAFMEYKFLNYMDAIFDNSIQQQLLGAGIRYHF